MSLVNQEKLNYFAQGLYSKIKANFDATGSASTAETNAKKHADDLNTTMDGRVTTLEGVVGDASNGLVKDVAVLKGDKNTEGSVAYQVAQIVAGADASYDTLKEIADWIMSDQTGAAKMANDIKANADAITDLETLVGTIPADATATDIVGYIAEYVQAQLTASDLSQYAKATDFNALKEVVGDNTKGLVKGLADVTTKATDNENAIATLNGTDDVVGSVAKAVKDGVAEAKAYTDTKDEAMNTKVTAVETKATDNESAIATLNGDAQTEGSVAKALKDAKAYADGLADVHVDASAYNRYNNTTGMINLYLNDGGPATYTEINYIASDYPGGYANNIYVKLSSLPLTPKYAKGTTIYMIDSDGNWWDTRLDNGYANEDYFNNNIIPNLNSNNYYAALQDLNDYYPDITRVYTKDGDNYIEKELTDTNLSNLTGALYINTGAKPTRIEVPVTELKDAITAIDTIDATLKDSVYVGVTSTDKFNTNVTYFACINGEFILDGTVTADNFKTKVGAGLYLTASDAIKLLAAKVDANTNAITQLRSDVTDTIADLKDVHIDASADNKYNAETGNVELYLNDSTVTTEFKEIEKIVGTDTRLSEELVLVKLNQSAVYNSNATYLGTVNETLYYETNDNTNIKSVADDYSYSYSSSHLFFEKTEYTMMSGFPTYRPVTEITDKSSFDNYGNKYNLYYANVNLYNIYTTNVIEVKISSNGSYYNSKVAEGLYVQPIDFTKAYPNTKTLYKKVNDKYVAIENSNIRVTLTNSTETLYMEVEIVGEPTKIEVPVTELKTAIENITTNSEAIGVETNSVNGVTATGIYARLESLESVMGTPSVKDDNGNITTPATGVQKQIEELEAAQNEIITEAQIDEMINGLV